MNVLRVNSELVEYELLPVSDLPALVRIAEQCEGTELTGVCKVIVTFVRTPLTGAFHSTNLLLGHEPLNDYDLFNCEECRNANEDEV